MNLASRSMALLLVLQVGGFVACAGTQRWPWVYTQRWPGPMEPTKDPLPKGDISPAGPEEVSVIRHADPARVRAAGTASSYPLRFFDKDVRMSAGSGVYTASGGRLEVLWPNGNSIVLTGNSVGVIGSPSRGEPCFLLSQVERALINFKVGDQVELVGGAVLRAKSGPFVIELRDGDVERVKNQSEGTGEIAFRDATFILDPGTVVDIPMLGAGGAPMLRDAVLTARDGPGFLIRYSGDVQLENQGSTVRVSAAGENALYALGVRLHLNAGEVAVLSGLEREHATHAAPASATTPAPREAENSRENAAENSKVPDAQPEAKSPP